MLCVSIWTPSIKNIDLTEYLYDLISSYTLRQRFLSLEDFLVIQGSWVTCSDSTWSKPMVLGNNNSKIIFLKCTISCSFNQSKKRTLKPISVVDWLQICFKLFFNVYWMTFPFVELTENNLTVGLYFTHMKMSTHVKKQ